MPVISLWLGSTCRISRKVSRYSALTSACIVTGAGSPCTARPTRVPLAFRPPFLVPRLEATATSGRKERSSSSSSVQARATYERPRANHVAIRDEVGESTLDFADEIGVKIFPQVADLDVRVHPRKRRGHATAPSCKSWSDHTILFYCSRSETLIQRA